VEREILKTGEDVDAILRIALQQEHGSTDELRQRLTRSAEDLGISPEALARAEEVYLAEGERHRNEQVLESRIGRFMQAKRSSFVSHFTSYLSTNLMLHVIWFLTGRDFYWPGIVLAAWGIGITSHYVHSRQRATTSDDDFQRWVQMGEPGKFRNDEDEEDDHGRRQIRRGGVTVGIHIPDTKNKE
jgi:hypothetical protein